MGTITINQNEYDNFKKLESEIKDIKKNYVSKLEMSEIFETLEILNDKNLMTSITKSDEDIRSGQTKKLTNFDELLTE